MDSDGAQAGPSHEGFQVAVATQKTPVKSRRLAGIKKKDLSSQTKCVVANVLKFVKSLADAAVLQTVDFNKSQEFTSKMCGISLRSVQRCVQEQKSSSTPGSIFVSPRKKYSREKKLTVLSDFDCDVARRTVLEFYDQGKFPTAEKLRVKLQEKIDYNGSVRSIRRLLHTLGFKYNRANDGRKFLLERRDIVVARAQFLRKMLTLKEEEIPNNRIYLDETWVNQNHTKQYIWQLSDKSGGLKVPTGKGGRLIVCHAGGAKGFIAQCKWVFRSKKSDTDYHSQMNNVSFKKWFTEDLLPSLEEPTSIIMDNAPYHSAQIDKIPSTNWRKQEIREWLIKKSIGFSDRETKAELLEKVAPFKQEKKYELDEVALSWGHEVVRLPPYHCQYNPIELIWAQVKREVAEKNRTFKIEDVEKLTSEAIDNVTAADWEKCVMHAEKLQSDDWEKEIVRDDIMEPFIINLRDDSSDSEEYQDSAGFEDSETEDF